MATARWLVAAASLLVCACNGGGAGNGPVGSGGGGAPASGGSGGRGGVGGGSTSPGTDGGASDGSTPQWLAACGIGQVAFSCDDRSAQTCQDDTPELAASICSSGTRQDGVACSSAQAIGACVIRFAGGGGAQRTFVYKAPAGIDEIRGACIYSRGFWCAPDDASDGGAFDGGAFDGGAASSADANGDTKP
jgi:hypothetical protein